MFYPVYALSMLENILKMYWQTELLIVKNSTTQSISKKPPTPQAGPLVIMGRSCNQTIIFSLYNTKTHYQYMISNNISVLSYMLKDYHGMTYIFTADYWIDNDET